MSAFFNSQSRKIGFAISYSGIFILLVWIGIFKFTPTEANAIQRLIENQPLMSWMYDWFDNQMVSNTIGSIELLTALMMLLALKWRWAKKVSSFMIIGTFIMTLSFLITTPGIWRIVDGIPVTDFFILKDLPLLGFGIMLLCNDGSH